MGCGIRNYLRTLLIALHESISVSILVLTCYSALFEGGSNIFLAVAVQREYGAFESVAGRCAKTVMSKSPCFIHASSLQHPSRAILHQTAECATPPHVLHKGPALATTPSRGFFLLPLFVCVCWCCSCIVFAADSARGSRRNHERWALHTAGITRQMRL